MTTEKPLAIALADALENFFGGAPSEQAAAELRRLHAELEATERQVEILSDDLSKCSKVNEALREMYFYIQFEVGEVRSENEALREALQACINYGAMTGDEWVAEKKWEQEDKDARRDEILAVACAVALALVTLLWLVAVTGIAP